MAIPILNEINNELKRIYAAGSSLAIDDPRIKKFIIPLKKMGERAPVFDVLASRLEAVTDADKNSPENLMEAGGLLYSLMYTQGSSSIEGEKREVSLSDSKLVLEKIPYSKLSSIIKVLSSSTQEHFTELRDLLDSGQYKDPRLFKAYCKAITDNKSFISNYVEENIIPLLGSEIIPFLEEELDIHGGKRNARLFRLLYILKGKDILPLSEEIIDSGTGAIFIEAIYTLGESKEYEELLLTYVKDKKADVKEAAYTALLKLKSEKAKELVLTGLSKSLVGYLVKPIIEYGDLEILNKVYEVFVEDTKNLETAKQKSNKIKYLLEILYSRNDEEGLKLLETFLSSEMANNIWGYIDGNNILNTLCRSENKRKVSIAYENSKKDKGFRYFEMAASIKLFSAAEVYEKYKIRISLDSSLGNVLIQEYIGYGRYDDYTDSEKSWDRRWAEFFIKQNNLNIAFMFIYDDDISTWEKLIKKYVEGVKKGKVSFYGRIIDKAIELSIPKAGDYFLKLLKLGFPKRNLSMNYPKYAREYFKILAEKEKDIEIKLILEEASNI